MLRDKKYATYYGEYSLKTWVRMILTKELILPGYQRHFVWTVGQAIKLMDSLSRGIFTPPVVIASYHEYESCTNNIILDGQQRLSSIILCYLGYWPAKFESKDAILANENSIEEDKTEEEIQEERDMAENRAILNWTLKNIQSLYAECLSLEDLKSKLSSDAKYIDIKTAIGQLKDAEKILSIYDTLKINEKMFRESFLGFSFITGLQTKSAEENKFFSEVFRKINTSGTSLTDAESRAAFYWLNPGRKDFFAPTFVEKVKVGNMQLDWVRSLAFCSEAAKIYTTRGNIPTKLNIAYGYSRKYEEYFERYAQCIVEDNNDSIFMPYESDYLDRIDYFGEYFSKLDKNQFPSLIDADFYIFGMMFWIIFIGKKMKNSNISELKNKLDTKIVPIKEEARSKRNPNALGITRERMYVSITTYKEHIEND